MSIPAFHVRTDTGTASDLRNLLATSKGTSLRFTRITVDGQKVGVVYAKNRSHAGRLIGRIDFRGREAKRQANLADAIRAVGARGNGVADRAFANFLAPDFEDAARVLSTLMPTPPALPLSDRVSIDGREHQVGARIAASSAGSAIHEGLDGNRQVVAIKVFDPPHGQKGVAAMKQALAEAQLMQQAVGDGHPNLVDCRGIAQVSGKVYIAMERMSNGDASRVIENMRNDANLGEEDRHLIVLTLHRDLAQGLAHAHANGVVHGDVKLDNLMIDDEGNGKIIDWGVGGHAGAYAGETGRDDSTYKSPQDARNDSIAFRQRGGKGWSPAFVRQPASDAWSLGASLVYCLTGRPAIPAVSNFSFENEAAVARFTSHAMPYTRQRAQTRGPQLEPYSDVLDPLLESDISKRATVAQVLQDPLFDDARIGSPEIRQKILAYAQPARA